jgi:hypothetical protein
MLESHLFGRIGGLHDDWQRGMRGKGTAGLPACEGKTRAN